ncbi:uncharacterized protein [Rutidosis leptorrhynchoides]|uniref:uncharacterized protein n=1 Tax=Rutidosis leptorrhynchoides TaxID=125765 RepID=UPI003A9A035B
MLATRYPRLFHLDIEAHCKVADRWINGSWFWRWTRDYLGSRNDQALIELINDIGSITLSEQEDQWSWNLSGDGSFTVAATRAVIGDNILPTSDKATRWFKFIPRKVNIFLWRFSLDRLPTRLKLSQKGLKIEDICCVFCHYGIESIEHVFFRYPIAIDVWRKVELWLDLDRDIPHFISWQELVSWIDDLSVIADSKNKILVIFATTLWTLWKLRNSVLFGPSPLRKNELFDFIRDMSFNWYCNRGRKRISWNVWLQKPL